MVPNRPQKEARRVRGTNLYLTPELVAASRALAKKRGVSLSKLVEKIIRRQVATAAKGAAK